MCPIRTSMECALEKLKRFDVVEMGIFKLLLVSFGVLLGIYANKTCRNLAPLWIFMFVICYAYVIYKLITPSEEEWLFFVIGIFLSLFLIIKIEEEILFYRELHSQIFMPMPKRHSMLYHKSQYLDDTGFYFV